LLVLAEGVTQVIQDIVAARGFSSVRLNKQDASQPSREITNSRRSVGISAGIQSRFINTMNLITFWSIAACSLSIFSRQELMRPKLKR
jgi:hypothetical protein